MRGLEHSSTLLVYRISFYSHIFDFFLWVMQTWMLLSLGFSAPIDSLSLDRIWVSDSGVGNSWGVGDPWPRTWETTGIICWTIPDRSNPPPWPLPKPENIFPRSWPSTCWAIWLTVFIIWGFWVSCCNIFLKTLGEPTPVCSETPANKLFITGLRRTWDIALALSNWPSALKSLRGLPSMTCPGRGATGSGGVSFAPALFVLELRDARDCKSCWPLIPASGFRLRWVLVVPLSPLPSEFGCLVRL